MSIQTLVMLRNLKAMSMDNFPVKHQQGYRGGAHRLRREEKQPEWTPIEDSGSLRVRHHALVRQLPYQEVLDAA